MPILLLLGGGVLALLIARSLADMGDEPDYAPPDPARGRTGYRRVDALLPDLRQAAESSKIPLGLLVGWIARASGGKLGAGGHFRLSPGEVAALGLDPRQLPTDGTYSINGGLLLIGKYAREVAALGIAPRGSPYFWRLVKLAHAAGGDAVKAIVEGARVAGAIESWDELRKYAGDSLKKGFNAVDGVYAIGAPFGFGSESVAIIGETDEEIPDPLELL